MGRNSLIFNKILFNIMLIIKKGYGVREAGLAKYQ